MREGLCRTFTIPNPFVSNNKVWLNQCVPKFIIFIALKDYDIAVVQLARPVTFRDEVSPACLPDNDQVLPEELEDPTSGRNCIVTGWGDIFGKNT